MTINFYLDSKLLDNNEKAVICFLRGIEKGKTTYINTRIKINPDFGIIRSKISERIILIVRN